MHTNPNPTTIRITPFKVESAIYLSCDAMRY